MGRILTPLLVLNPAHPERNIKCVGLVDTGASLLVLPKAWKDRLGELEQLEPVPVELANQSKVQAERYGPVKIQLEGFDAIFSEALFIEMNTEHSGSFEPLIGYIVLEQSRAAIDMVGHRLLKVDHLDAKQFD